MPPLPDPFDLFAWTTIMLRLERRRNQRRIFLVLGLALVAVIWWFSEVSEV